MSATNSGIDTTEPILAACPIAGDHELVDSWGWRRSGGRRHQGIDVGAPRGTELYAVRDGQVDFKQNRLGGNAVWLTTDDGDKFYYAHLDAFAGDDRAVTAGELIGYVGSTGNAGGPHLHFETHPMGDAANPFEHVVEACTASDRAGDAVSAIDAFVARIRAQRPDSPPRLPWSTRDAAARWNSAVTPR